MRVLVILTAVFAAQASAQDMGQRLHLLCQGGGFANRIDQSSARFWNDYGDSATAMVESTARVSFENQLQLWIEGDEGRVRMPPAMLPLVRGGEDGWFKLSSLEVTEGEIRGTVKVNLLNNPKLRLDRFAGTISISGKAGDFQGRCVKFDPARTQRQF